MTEVKTTDNGDHNNGNNNKNTLCPHCNSKTLPALFCHNCQKVLPIAHVMPNDYFAWFGMKEVFRIANAELEKKLTEYLNLLHPDRFVKSTAIEKQIATENSALYNKAFAVLSSPAERAHYILTQHGYDMDEVASDHNHSHSNNVLFLEAFMWREKLENANSIFECQKLIEEFQYLAHEMIHAIGENLEKNDHDRAYSHSIKLKFILRFQQEIIEKINQML